MDRTHRYPVHLTWEGRPSDRYTAYGRSYRLRFDGKHEIVGSADPAFLGDPRLHNPEDLFVASVAACHMLTYLALATKARIGVSSYVDRPEGELKVDRAGSGQFTRVTLRPTVTVGDPTNADRARALHHDAHAQCFIARACVTPIEITSAVEVAPTTPDRLEDPDAGLRDVAVNLPDAPGALATLGETLGTAGVSLEGGGAWSVDGRGHAHFLVRDGDAAELALRQADLKVTSVRRVLIQRLAQGVPGQLGSLTRHLARHGVNIEALYSDHDHRMVLVVDDPEAGAKACASWRPANADAQR